MLSGWVSRIRGSLIRLPSGFLSPQKLHRAPPSFQRDAAAIRLPTSVTVRSLRRGASLTGLSYGKQDIEQTRP